MMANAPVAQKGGFASVIGTGKPAAAMDGMGVDFLALLEQAEAMPASGAPNAEGQASDEAGFAAGSALPGLQMAADEASPTVAPVPGLTLPASGEKAVDRGAISQKAVDQPAAAKLVQANSMLPQLVMTANPTANAPLVEKAADADKNEEPAAPEDGEAKLALADNLALPLLQNIELIAQPETSDANKKNGQMAAVTDDPQAAALKAFALPPAALRQAANLPEQAAEPAHRKALERLETGTLPDASALPETAQAQEKASATAAVHRKAAAAAEVSSPITIPTAIVDAAEKTSTPSPRRAADMQPVEAAAAPASPAPVVSAAMSLMPVAPTMVADVAAPAIAAPITDTAALLGERVIDMGVEGQWIDRMAREIADISAGTGRASFTLNPGNLGRLQVEILQRDEGADVRLIAETDDAVNALNQGRQQLQQDSRLQTARINDVQIERSNANSDSAPVTRSAASGQELAQQQSHSQSQAFHKKPQIESVSSMVRDEEPGEGADNALSSRNARYA